MNRRGFLGGILAASFAPAIVGSGVLMPVRQIILPALGESWVYVPRLCVVTGDTIDFADGRRLIVTQAGRDNIRGILTCQD